MTRVKGNGGGTIDLDSDSSIRKTIARAADGDKRSAWWLIHQLTASLRERRLSGPLFDYAADFLDALLDIDDAKEGRATPRDLGKAFAALHIVRKRGQPERQDDDKLTLAACVALLREVGFSTDNALGALSSLGDHPRDAYRTAFDEQGELLGRLPSSEELEALAKVSLTELLDDLLAAGSITRAEFQNALEAVKRAQVAARGKRTS